MIKIGARIEILTGNILARLYKGDTYLVVETDTTAGIFAVRKQDDGTLFWLAANTGGIEWKLLDSNIVAKDANNSNNFNVPKPKSVEATLWKGSQNMPYDSDIDNIEDYKWR